MELTILNVGKVILFTVFLVTVFCLGTMIQFSLDERELTQTKTNYAECRLLVVKQSNQLYNYWLNTDVNFELLRVTEINQEQWNKQNGW